MAENAAPTTSSALPPQLQSSAGAPGQQQFDGSQGNSQANPSHMPPPPLAPVVIPQNTNPIPTAMTSPMSGNMMSPTSAGGYVRRAAPEPNKRALYVGGLDPRVTEDILRQIFETTGHVQSVKIIPDKNVRVQFPSQTKIFWLTFLPLSVSKQGLELWLCGIRRPRCRRTRYANTSRTSRTSVCKCGNLLGSCPETIALIEDSVPPL